MSSPRHTFILFSQFQELKIGIFGKDSGCTSDEECASKLGFEQCSKLCQVHGDVMYIAEEIDGIPEGDGLITKKRDHAISVRWADCQSFVIYAPQKKVLAVLHAGWRGMAAKAITTLYNRLKESFDIDPNMTYVGITPSLCKQCAEFSDPIKELPKHLHPFVEEKCVDLQAAADHELASLGVPKDHIERHPTCTRCGEGFWSWRRDKNENARNYLVVGLP